MNEIITYISQPWSWYVSGFMIALVFLFLNLAGGQFGVSSNLRTVCAAMGAGKKHDFFNFDWKAQKWNLAFLVGSVIGGFIATHLLTQDSPIQLSENTLHDLQSYGIEVGKSILPESLFSLQSLFSLKGFIVLVIGGFLVGFGSRYAGGCTSGHAISGLSNLQIPSLIAVIGFFIGGLIMNWLILPLILN